MTDQVRDFIIEINDCMKMAETTDISKFPLEDQLAIILAYKELFNKIKPIYVKNLVRDMN